MGEVIVDSTELERIVFGNIHDIELMDSPLPIEDRMRILHKEFHVESDGSVMRIRPVGSDVVVLLRLSSSQSRNDSHSPFVGVVFDSDRIPEPDIALAFCHFRVNADFHDRVIDRMTMVGCFFESPLHMDLSIVSGPVEMDGSTFTDDAVFTAAVFAERASFSHCTFLGRCDFNSAEFRGKASFRSSQFYGVTDFADVSFRNKALFDRLVHKFDSTPTEPSCFHDHVSFKNARFDHYATFSRTRFLGESLFNSAMFNGKTFFEGEPRDVPYYANVVFKSTRFGTYTCFGDIRLGKVVFESVKCQGDIIFDNVRLENPFVVTKLVSSGYTTFRNLGFESESGQLSLKDSTFNGDLDIDMMTDDTDARPVDRILLKTCWITGHLHVAGNISRVDMDDTTSNGPLSFDIQTWRSSFLMGIPNSIINSSAQFNWITVRKVDGRFEADVERPMSCDELFSAVRGPKNEDSRFSDAMVSSQMLALRGVMVRTGRFDDSDYFLRKYNEFHRKSSGLQGKGMFSALVSGIGSLGARVIGSYGTRPIQILLWMIVVPVVIGGCLAIIRGDALGGLLDGFVAFITMSLGVDTSGLGDMEKVLLVVDGFLGVFLMSFFVTSLARKLFR